MMGRKDVGLSAEEECLSEAVTAAWEEPCFTAHGRDMTEACPDLVRLLIGAESGDFDAHDLQHLSGECRYCSATLRRIFADVCPPPTLAREGRQGALGTAFDAHAAGCERCTGIAAALELSASAAPQPGRASLRGVRDAVDEWRSGDPTRRLGIWIVLGGAAVAIAGLQSRSLGLPWGADNVAQGLATCAVGSYMASGRDRVTHTRRHRAVFALALVVLAFFAGITAWRFHPLGSGELTTVAARVGLGVGALLAGVACVIGFAGVALRRPPSSGAEEAVNTRLALTRWSIRACGAACLAYATGHLVIAVGIAPNVPMQVSTLVASAFLVLAARESYRPLPEYRRIVFFWIRWGLIELPPGHGNKGAEGERAKTQRRGTGNEPGETDAGMTG